MSTNTTTGITGELRAAIGSLCRRLRKESHLGDFTWSQMSVIHRLSHEGPATVTALANSENMRTQSMGAIVASMEAAGLLERSPDPADGRQSILSLTPAAQEKLRAARAAREDWLIRTMQAKLSPDEQAELLKCAALLKRLTED